MIIPFTELATISLSEIDRVINELEAMLEGKLDYSNIGEYNGVKMPVSTNSVFDVDGYYRSMKFIANEGPGEKLFLALAQLAAKLDAPYQMTTANTIVSWELNKDTRRSEGTKVDRTIDMSPGLVHTMGETESLQKGLALSSKATARQFRKLKSGKPGKKYLRFSNWSSVESGVVEKARDLKVLTFRDLFILVSRYVPTPGLTALSSIYNVNLDDPARCDSVEFTARHVPATDSYMEVTHVGESIDVDSISNDYKYMIVYVSSGEGESLAISMQVTTDYIMGAIV